MKNTIEISARSVKMFRLLLIERILGYRKKLEAEKGNTNRARILSDKLYKLALISHEVDVKFAKYEKIKRKQNGKRNK
jgi:ribosomal protein S17